MCLVVDFKTEVTYDIGRLPCIAKTWVFLRKAVLALQNALTSTGKRTNFLLDIQGGSKVCEAQLHF